LNRKPYFWIGSFVLVSLVGIGATPADKAKLWGIHEKGCTNGLVLRGKARARQRWIVEQPSRRRRQVVHVLVADEVGGRRVAAVTPTRVAALFVATAG
jgi:hypothetical protein